MSDLVVWLEAELARVGGLARAATPGPWEPKSDDPGDDEVYTVHDGEHGDLVGNPVAYVRSGMFRSDEGRMLANMRLIASCADPAAVLRRVAADRQILAEHANDYGDCAACGRPSEERNERGYAFFAEVEWPCRVVRLLAEAYGWAEETHG